jgi:hypothetical protein
LAAGIVGFVRDFDKVRVDRDATQAMPFTSASVGGARGTERNR